MKEEKNTDIFPKHFFWGASTSAHQVEGGNDNQWTVWELEHAKQLAQTAHIRLNWLPRYEAVKDQAEEPENYVSGQGVDHYNRYKEDFDLLKELNLNSFRFSVEWSRLEPEEGKWNEEAVAHYKRYIMELRKRKIEPFINLWHWTAPKWFIEKGGFEKRSNLVYFDRFVKKVSEELIDEVEYILTLNEPNVYASFGYLIGEHPPALKNPLLFAKVYWNLTRVHRRAYKILKAKKPSLQIGVAHQLANIQPKRAHNLSDIMTTEIMRYFWNWWFLHRIRRYQDFVGINYYFADYYTGFGKRKNPKVPLSDLGWYMEPEGVYPLILRAWSHFKKPIFLTESGLADAHDIHRRWWIEETTVAMERALSEGVDVRGCFHWSLLDNFEWSFGWWPKFGLVAVDRKHDMKRSVRPSARWFARWLKNLEN